MRTFIMLLMLALSFSAIGNTENEVRTFKIYFPVGRSHFDASLGQNVATLDSLRVTIDRLNSDDRANIDSVIVVGSASPEGSAAINARLSASRAQWLCKVLRLRHLVPDSLLRIIFTGANVSEFRAIIDGSIAPEEVYPKLRYASAAIHASHFTPPIYIIHNQQVAILDSLAVNAEPIAAPREITTVGAVVEPHVEVSSRSWRVKTNAVGWGMLVSNVAVEYDFAKQWSVALPIYYSGINYFSIKTKFRTFTVQPELRYWFGSNHTGFFAAAHFGIGYFNFATGSKFRIQDHKGKCPAYGGGLAAGWRMNLSRNHRWQLEFTAGVGAYRANYDKFENRLNGPLVEEGIHKTFFGVDQAAATFIYVF